MTFAFLESVITEIGKELIVGFTIDNSRRTLRKTIDGVVQTFDERFTLDAATEALIVLDADPTGVEFKTYTHAENIQAIITVTTAEDVGKLDKRYAVG